MLLLKNYQLYVWGRHVLQGISMGKLNMESQRLTMRLVCQDAVRNGLVQIENARIVVANDECTIEKLSMDFLGY